MHSMVLHRRSLGTTGVASGKDSSGVAYVVIPEDQDRDVFITTCYRTQTVMLRDEMGAAWRNVFVTKDLLQQVVFPEKSSERGSSVIWVKIPKHNLPVVLGVLDLKNIYSVIQEEHQFRLQQRSPVGNSVDFNARALSASLDLAVASTEDGKGSLRVKITNPDQTAELDVYVKGNINVFADKKIRLGTNEELTMEVVKPDLSPLGILTYKAGTGWTLKDEFNNEVTTESGHVRIKVSDGKLIHIDQTTINLGQDNAAQPVPLGDTLKEKLTDLINAIKQITVPTSNGPSGTPINFAQFDTISAQLAQILSQVSKTD